MALEPRLEPILESIRLAQEAEGSSGVNPRLERGLEEPGLLSERSRLLPELFIAELVAGIVANDAQARVVDVDARGQPAAPLVEVEQPVRRLDRRVGIVRPDAGVVDDRAL